MNKKGFATIPLIVGVLIVVGLIGYLAFRSTVNKQEPIVGGDRDIHGCIGSAGYSWCEVKQKCLRSWEESCSAPGSSTTSTSTSTSTATSTRSSVDAKAFEAFKNDTDCARDKNEAYIIDGKMVLTVRKDRRCADASYGYALFGGTPQDQLCTYGDSIAGPRMICQNEIYKPLFQSLLDAAEKGKISQLEDHTVLKLY